MSFLQSAIELANMGFHVFPLEVNGKLPIIQDFPNLATKDHAQIKKWWLDPVMEIEKAYNVGISTTHYNSTQALVVVDVDNKNGKKGSDEVFRLEMEGHLFSQTFTQSTPTGGEHFVYASPKPVKQGVSVLAKGLDIRSKGGYIVGPGSVIDGVSYKKTSDVITDCPEWIIQACSKIVEKEVSNKKIENINAKRAFMRSTHYLEKEAPLAHEGDGGDHATFKVAARLKDFGVDQITAFELMTDLWNDRCDPPWDLMELEKKVENAFGYGNHPAGISSPEADFEVVKESPDDDINYLENINNEYALIFGDGAHSVLQETVDQKGRSKRNFMPEATFNRKFSHTSVLDGKKLKTYSNMWLNWKDKRTYNGLCFTPEREPKHGYYNLWGGFTCKPTPYKDASVEAKKGFDDFMEHALKNVCENDTELFDWLIGYFAHMIQRPYEKPLTSLVFGGLKGVGKNALVDRVGNLLGSGHYLVAHDSRYLTSNFNGHLDAALCLVLDEAFWSGDKSAEGKLKGITTSPEILIERKGKEPYLVDNLVRLIIIGNEDWLVPASVDERRYAVFKVGNGRMQDRKFFHDMRVNIDKKGGNEVLLHHLKNFDLSKVEVNAAPNTVGLSEQKLSSLDLLGEFWLECLHDGEISSTMIDGWPEQISKKVFREAFYKYCKNRNVKTRNLTQDKIGKTVRKFVDFKQGTKMKSGTSWTSCYNIPELEACREMFEGHYKYKINWD